MSNVYKSTKETKKKKKEGCSDETTEHCFTPKWQQQQSLGNPEIRSQDLYPDLSHWG